MKVSISENPITAKAADVPVNIPMNLSCDADDLFDSTCKAQKAIISLNGYTNEVPLNISMKSGDSKSLNITAFSEPDLLMPPFNYRAWLFRKNKRVHPPQPHQPSKNRLLFDSILERSLILSRPH